MEFREGDVPGVSEGEGTPERTVMAQEYLSASQGGSLVESRLSPEFGSIRKIQRMFTHNPAILEWLNANPTPEMKTYCRWLLERKNEEGEDVDVTDEDFFIPSEFPEQPYKICSRVGGGAFGNVFSAESPHPGEGIVALKRSSSKALERLRREYEMLRIVGEKFPGSHPKLLMGKKLELSPGGRDVLYITEEFLEGQSLQNILNERGKLSLKQAVDVLQQLMVRLLLVHRAGVIHRDIKPENILIGNDGMVSLVDYGLARLNRRTAVRNDNDKDIALTMTQGNSTLGTIRFMPPEQIGDASGADELSDINAAVQMFCMMATGRPAYAEAPEGEAARMSKTIENHKEGVRDQEARDGMHRLIEASGVNKRDQQRLRTLIDDALNASPEARPQLYQLIEGFLPFSSHAQKFASLRSGQSSDVGRTNIISEVPDDARAANAFIADVMEGEGGKLLSSYEQLPTLDTLREGAGRKMRKLIARHPVKSTISSLLLAGSIAVGGVLFSPKPRENYDATNVPALSLKLDNHGGIHSFNLFARNRAMMKLEPLQNVLSQEKKILSDQKKVQGTERYSADAPKGTYIPLKDADGEIRGFVINILSYRRMLDIMSETRGRGDAVEMGFLYRTFQDNGMHGVTLINPENGDVLHYLEQGVGIILESGMREGKGGMPGDREGASWCYSDFGRVWEDMPNGVHIRPGATWLENPRCIKILEFYRQNKLTLGVSLDSIPVADRARFQREQEYVDTVLSKLLEEAGITESSQTPKQTASK